MTPARRFFYRYAQSWCRAATDDDLRKVATDDSHALPEYRVNGPLSNLPGFADAFACKADSRMRRSAAQTCRVW